MPSQILHCLFGEDLYNKIAASGRKSAILELITSHHKDEFLLGCQGPDIFYHSLGRRPVALSYGTLLHRRGIGTFCETLLAEARAYAVSDACLAYALGFISHPFLDRSTHPYIVYKSHSVFPRSHAFFERIIDVLMLKHLREQSVKDWYRKVQLEEICQKPHIALKELLATSLIKSFPEKAGKDAKIHERIKNAFLDSASFYKHTSPYAIKERALTEDISKKSLIVIHPKELPEDIDFLNMNKEPWYEPVGGGEDNRSFPEIYNEAVQSAAASLACFLFNFLDGRSLIESEAAAIIGNGGLSIQDSEGKPCIPLHVNALPLDKVLDIQAVLWGIN